MQRNNRKNAWKAYFLSFFSICIFCSSYSVTGYAGEKNEEHFILTYAENQIESYPTTEGAQYFAEIVKEETKGRIEIIVKTGGTLGTESEVLDQLRYGGIDFARVALSQFSDLIPEYNVLQLPYLYESSEHMWKVLDGQIGKDFLELASEVGVVGLSWYDGGVRSFYTSEKPITCLEDFEGMKIRVQESSIMEDMINELGASAVQVPYPDVYSYLERGMVDGAENSWPSYESMHHYEVAKYYTENEHSRIPEIQLISAHTWNKLSEEDQNIIREAAQKSSEYERVLWHDQEEKSRNHAEELGVSVMEISPEENERIRDAVSVIYEKYSYGQDDIIEEIRRIANEK